MVVRVRTFTENDLPIIVKLLNETRRGSYEFCPYDEERLRSWIDDGKLQVLMVEEDRKPFGSAAYSDGYWGEEIKWLAVPSRPNRTLVESLLVEETEKLVQRGTVFNVVDAGSPKIDEWIKRGYAPDNGLYHMTARLDAVKPFPKAPEGVVIRSLSIDEEKEFVDAVNAGFGTERLRVGNVELWKSENPPFNEEWVHLALTGDSIVSVVVSKPDTRYNRFFNGKRGYLGPATTLPENRGRNLASALTVRAMSFLMEKGMDSVALYTAEQNTPSVTLLQKLGFRISHHWRFMRKNIPVKSELE